MFSVITVLSQVSAWWEFHVRITKWAFRADKLIVLVQGEQLSDDVGTQMEYFLAQPARDASGRAKGIGAGAPGGTPGRSPHMSSTATPLGKGSSGRPPSLWDHDA